MTDDILRDLVTKHDKVIDSLIMSVEHLVNAQSRTHEQQAETNHRLEEISKYLAKQMVFDTKLQSMDKDLSDSFRRVHLRIDALDIIQNSDGGCSSTRLLSKDVAALVKEVDRVANTINNNKLELNNVSAAVNSFISPATSKWIAGFGIAYIVIFGTYVVQSIHSLDVRQENSIPVRTWK